MLAAAFFAIVFQFFMQGTVFSFTSAAAKEIGATPFWIGFATVLYTLVQVAGAGVIGKRLLARMKAWQAVTLGCVLLVVSALLVAFGVHMALICLGQLVAGVGNLMLSAVLMSMVVRHTPQERQSTAMGLYQAIYGLGMSAGPVLVGQWVTFSGYRGAYLIVAGLMAIAALLAPVVIRLADREPA